MLFLSIWNRTNPCVTLHGFREQSKRSRGFRCNKKIENTDLHTHFLTATGKMLFTNKNMSQVHSSLKYSTWSY